MHVARFTVGDALPCAQYCLIFAPYQQKTNTNFLMSNKKWKRGVVYNLEGREIGQSQGKGGVLSQGKGGGGS
jgi:hypothetical protein